MRKIVYVQTVLFEEDVIALKEKTGEKQTQAALSKAVHHYLKCDKDVDLS